MTDKEKNFYMKYCKYDKESKEVIVNLVQAIEGLTKTIKKQENAIIKMAEELTHLLEEDVETIIKKFKEEQ